MGLRPCVAFPFLALQLLRINPAGFYAPGLILLAAVVTFLIRTDHVQLTSGKLYLQPVLTLEIRHSSARITVALES